ncbi:BnaCnng42330D [Brassica napus]|uniref:BnaCnng42330D protein n=1 Tax=Brassica napus TaxID=3708 RepID=A0A078JC61_BRANA|nr:BnaCnng42330D [Brassica napus]
MVSHTFFIFFSSQHITFNKYQRRQLT